ncbi:MAG TPA: choice-of-anchor tandem repeat GloVer-containing protein [Tepidisphaeraceae bacterium]|jgi:uncharacterized repeat protein (TIGR03803 family)|nr:choice-of-anchor tandem repeat GloVer-containing protein [Tepidisphaeraceae bacterium]
MNRRTKHCDQGTQHPGKFPAYRAAFLGEQLESRVMLSATLSTIATFNGANGNDPHALVVDSAGNLFGVTTNDTATGTGNVFEVPAGSNSVTVLYHFTGGADGQTPESLVIDSSGNLFGSTSAGGAGGFGTLFEIPHGASTPNTLLSLPGTGSYTVAGVDSADDIFVNSFAGVYEVASGTTTLMQISSVSLDNSLMLASNGNLYGTHLVSSDSFGNPVSDGDVFEINTANDMTTTLASFDTSGDNGSGPIGLTVDSAGNVFGVTDAGGMNNSGTAFEIKNGSGAITTLAFFNQDATSVGGTPICAPMLDASGDLIGINFVGAANGDGAVWGIPAGTTSPQDLVDLTSDDVPGPVSGYGPGAGFASSQTAVATPDELKPADLFTDYVGRVFFGLGGPNADKESGGLGWLLLLAGGGDSGGGGSGGSGANASAVTGKVPSSVVGGATANSNVSVSVQNTGSAQVKGNVTVQLYVSPDGSLGDATPVGSPVTKKVSIKPSKSAAIHVKIKSFPSEPSGSYQLIASVTGPSGNSSSAAGPSLMIAPAFVSTLVSALDPMPASIKPGHKEILDFTVTNNGNTTAVGTASMAIALSTSPSGSSPQPITGVPVKIKLKPGTTRHFKVRFAIPTALTPAAYYVAGTLDVTALGDTSASDGSAVSATSFTVTQAAK